MTKSFTATATTAATVVESVSCQVFHVQITKAGDATSSVTLYDNASAASGTVIWQGGGTTTGDFDLSDGAGDGRQCANGVTVAIAGSTAPNVVITYV